MSRAADRTGILLSSVPHFTSHPYTSHADPVRFALVRCGRCAPCMGQIGGNPPLLFGQLRTFQAPFSSLLNSAVLPLDQLTLRSPTL